MCYRCGNTAFTGSLPIAVGRSVARVLWRGALVRLERMSTMSTDTLIHFFHRHTKMYLNFLNDFSLLYFRLQFNCITTFRIGCDKSFSKLEYICFFSSNPLSSHFQSYLFNNKITYKKIKTNNFINYDIVSLFRSCVNCKLLLSSCKH